MTRFSPLSKKLMSNISGILRRDKIPSYIVQGIHNPQQAVDLFKGNWASRLPIPGISSGESELFSDERIQWFLSKTGGVKEKSVLELGPLEAGHTYMMDRAGASKIVAIESNGKAWLKCLAVKELLGISSAQFLLGDFMSYLQAPDTPKFDVCNACGVLYHLRDPQNLFPLIRAHCNGPVLVWTAIWSEQIPLNYKWLNYKFTTTRKVTLSSGKQIELHRHNYGLTIGHSGFWGGNAGYSEWMSRESVISAAEAGGYRVDEIAFDEPNGPNSPSVALLLIPVTSTPSSTA